MKRTFISIPIDPAKKIRWRKAAGKTPLATWARDTLDREADAVLASRRREKKETT